MQFEKIKKGDYLIVKFLGNRLDANIAVEFKDALLEIIHNGYNRLILDISPVEFVDSSGLGTIVSCYKAMGDQGILILVGLRHTVRTLFQLTRMDRIFKTFDTWQEAFEATH